MLILTIAFVISVSSQFSINFLTSSASGSTTMLTSNGSYVSDNDAGFQPGVVLDLFVGSGTVCSVAKKMGLNYIGIDLVPAYVQLARKRLAETPENFL